MGLVTFATIKRHVKLRLKPKFKLSSMKPKVSMTDPLAALSSKSDFTRRSRSAECGYTQRSLPVSTRNWVFDLRSVTKRRPVCGRQSFVAATDCLWSFPTSRSHKASNTCWLDVQTWRGTNTRGTSCSWIEIGSFAARKNADGSEVLHDR